MGSIFSALYDLLMSPLEKQQFGDIRSSLIRQAKGQVLEVGSGTGLNFPYYESHTVVSAIEPDPEMSRQSIRRKQQAQATIHLYTAFAEQLPFNDDTFDCAVATLVFCTITQPQLALQEMIRVCKPGANLLFFEHVRVHQPVVGIMQDVLTPAWKRVAGGCHLNRDTLRLLAQSDLLITDVQSHYGGVFLIIKCEKPVY